MNQPACNAMHSIACPQSLRDSVAGGRAVREATGKTYLECIRMLNGLEKSLERHLSEKDRRWAVAEVADEYGRAEPRTLNTEH